MADSSTEKANETETKEDAPMEEEFHDAATVHNGENMTLTGLGSFCEGRAFFLGLVWLCDSHLKITMLFRRLWTST
jgi:hypothetical protein